MAPHFTPPGWLEALGWLSLGVAFASALVIAADIARGYRQKMWIMNVVYPVTALYWGPFALWFYFAHGRRSSRPVIEREGGAPDPDRLPRWSVTAKGISHCGAGCTLGDIAAEWLVFATGLMLAGKSLYADFPLDFAFAWLLGVGFQYFTIAPMRGLSGAKGIWAAIKADTLSILAFQLGLFLGMWLYQQVVFAPGLPKTTAAYWMMMQVAMILGFFTAWPVNAWLVRAGWKERM